MNILGILQTYGQTNPRARSQKIQSTQGAVSGGAGGTPSSAAQTEPAKPLTGLNVLSRVQTTLPGGATLSVFRFDLGRSDSGSSPALPTEFEKRSDQEMLRALKELANYFDYSPTTADIELEGTAAIDLRDQTG